jgi:hypothetical protein
VTGVQTCALPIWTRVERLLRSHKVGVLTIEEVAPSLEDSFIEIITREGSR